MDWPFSKDCFISTLIHKLRHTCWFWTRFQSLHLKFPALLVLVLTYHSAFEPPLAKGHLEKKGPLKFHSCCSDISLWALYWEIESNNLAITNTCLNNLFQHPAHCHRGLPFPLAGQPLTAVGKAGRTRRGASSVFFHASAGNAGPKL